MTPERWALLKTLFHQAGTVPRNDQGAFLEAACKGDKALQASLIELLKNQDTATSFLDGPMLSPERLTEIVSFGLRTFVPGEIAARRFRIIRFIAEGGMGEVYAAEDLELNETVALKTMRPILARDPRILVRFKQEIQLARKVTHRNVSRVFDLFRHELERGQTVVFLSMELLEGETLANRIHRMGRPPVAEAENIAVQIAAGLDAAHSAGIIHSDLKCANIALVASPGEKERAVIMDFGLARTLREPHSGVAGTPAYMAPEQIADEELTPACDIYAFGVVLFEMASGELPFRGDTPLESLHLRSQAPAKLLRAVAPGAPLAWEQAIEACLQNDPAKRPKSAAAVAEALTARFKGLQKNAVIATATILLALALAAGAFLAGRPHTPLPEAQAAFDNAQVKIAYRSPAGFRDAIANFKRAIQLDPRWAEPWAEIAYAYADAANTSQLPGASAALEARKAATEALRLDNQSAKAHGALGWVESLDFDEWPKAEASLRRAIALSPNDARLHYWLGVHLRKKGKFSEAESEDREALALSHQTDPRIWCEVAFLFWTMGRLDRMQDFMKDLLVAYPNFGLARFLNARLLKEQGRFDEAASELEVSRFLQYSPITVLAEKASLEAYRGRREAAHDYLRQLREASEKGPVDGLLIAGVCAKLGESDEAFDWLERAYARKDSTLLSAATSPLLQPLHNDPRFESLLRRLHYRT